MFADMIAGEAEVQSKREASKMLATVAGSFHQAQEVLRQGELLPDDAQRFMLMVKPYDVADWGDATLADRLALRDMALSEMVFDDRVLQEWLTGLARLNGGWGSSREMSVLLTREDCPSFVTNGILQQSLCGLDGDYLASLEGFIFNYRKVPWEILVELFLSQSWRSRRAPAAWLEQYAVEVDIWLQRKHPALVGMPAEWIADVLFPM